MSTVVELSPPMHVVAGNAPRWRRTRSTLSAVRFAELDATLFDGIGGLIDSVLDRCMWCEDEIEAALLRHDERGRGPLWNSFRILRPTQERPWPELVYRAHCRELFERVAAGIDTSPATEAEKFAVLSAASQVAPLDTGAVTLYLRIGARMFPEIFDGICDVLDVDAYEKVHGSLADDYEAQLTRKLAQPWRKIGVTAEDIDQMLLAPHE